MTYARETKVPVDRSRAEIESTLRRYGAKEFAFGHRVGRADVAFRLKDRNVRISLPLPQGDSRADQQLTRARWRALLLVMKAKLESVDAGIETFEQAFFANIVMPDGRTVYESARGTVQLAYEKGAVLPLLPPPG